MKDLKEVVNFSQNVEYTFIATAGKDCSANIDTVKSLELISGNQIDVKECLCDRTILNLNENKNCTLLVWNEEQDAGYELNGRVVDMQTLAFLDGYKSGSKEKETLPQVLWNLKIDIEEINEFSHAPKEAMRIITKDDRTITERME